MMDPGQEPTASELRDFSRRVREVVRPDERRTKPFRSTSPGATEKSPGEDPHALIEELRVADEELRAQNEELVASRQAVDQERVKYRALFDFAPDAYLVTDMYGTISEANLAAGRLLGVEAKFLAGKPLPAFFDEGGRREYRQQLDRICDTELLERQIHGPLTEAQLRDLRRIQQSQQHLLGLINTILDFARLDSGQAIEVRPSPIVVHDILCDMEGFIGSQLEKKELKYHYHCSDKKLVAQADREKVQQIVLNLLANALKFTPAGGHISLGCEPAKESVAIPVADSR